MGSKVNFLSHLEPVLAAQGSILNSLLHAPRNPESPGDSSRFPAPANRAEIWSATSVYSRISRGFPINAGWNNSTAASVVRSESAKSLPMLEVPG